MNNLNSDELYFIPLGGSEQFGVNLNVYAYKGRILIIDCGIGFADERFPGIDLLLPDPAFLEKNQDKIEGLIITHAHEDHVGAVAHLWPRLQCPVFCSPFTAAVLKNKLTEKRLQRDVNVQIIRPGKNLKELGPFRIGAINVTHSIPDTRALVIETDLGKVIHSADWNLDPAPVQGKPTDEERFIELGEKGVLAYIGDSTNADIPGRSKSESEVEKGLEELFSELTGTIAVTMFASNIGRLRSVALAAKAAGRTTALVGRSLNNMYGCACSCGYMESIPEFIDIKEIKNVAPSKLVIAVTGSQGESRAALARISKGEMRDVKLGEGDTVVFSARPIPGNEKDINNVKNNLVAGKVQVISSGETEHLIHTSGHPHQDEILSMYEWLKPEIVIPVHGERMQLEAHGNLAREHGIKNVIVPQNGSIIRLAPGTPEIIDHIETGILAIDQNRYLPSDHPSISSRRKLQFTGAAHITVVMDSRGNLINEPQISTEGLCSPDEDDLENQIADEIVDIIEDIMWEDRDDDAFISEEIRIGVRRLCSDITGLKPKTTVHLVRI